MTDLAIFDFDGDRLDLIRQHSAALHTVARYSDDDVRTVVALVDRIIVARLQAEFKTTRGNIS